MGGSDTVQQEVTQGVGERKEAWAAEKPVTWESEPVPRIPPALEQHDPLHSKAHRAQPVMVALKDGLNYREKVASALMCL